MKKIFLSFFAVAALALTSCGGGAGDVLNMDPAQCDDTTEKCWKYTLSYAGYDADAYMWGTEKAVVEVIQESVKATGLSGYKATMEESAAEDAVACLAKY